MGNMPPSITGWSASHSARDPVQQGKYSQSSTLPPVLTTPALQHHAGTSASPDLTEDPGNKVPKWTHNPAGRDETSPETTTSTKSEGTVHSETVTNEGFKSHLMSTSSAVATSPHTDVPVVMMANTGTASSSAAAGGLSSTPTPRSTTPLHHVSTTESKTLMTRDPTTATTTFSSQPAHTVQDVSFTAHTSTTQPQSESHTTGRPSTSAPDPAGPTHQEVPSELNVGDEDLKGPRYHSSSPLDPLLAGLLSVFIVTTAIVFVILFLKFRQRTNHPEFHRLQDLPMDDLMEDTPLSRYTY
uniref:Si:ch73-344o19.1 n=1 Tax=Seriola dumerili TaxID=41447 RepID=A0A3B4TUY5_SERDU